MDRLVIVAAVVAALLAAGCGAFTPVKRDLPAPFAASLERDHGPLSSAPEAWRKAASAFLGDEVVAVVQESRGEAPEGKESVYVAVLGSPAEAAAAGFIDGWVRSAGDNPLTTTTIALGILYGGFEAVRRFRRRRGKGGGSGMPALVPAPSGSHGGE